MNGAFSTLKEMIPACRGADEREGNGKEMHKLDVLNAGIEYLGYLEKCLERMNERQWEAKHVRTQSIQEEEEENDEDDEDLREYRSSVGQGKQPKGQGYQHYSGRQEKEDGREKKKQDYYATSRPCHCHCHCQSHCHAREDEGTDLPPRLPAPLATPSLLLLQQQNYDHAVHRTYENDTIKDPDTVRDRDRDRARDHEETTNTAAALLMLTSTDRRGNTMSNTNTTIDSISKTRNHVFIPSVDTHHQIQTQTIPPPWKAETRTPTVKGGLSVRDLLLK
jgi:hypothetical protein